MPTGLPQYEVYALRYATRDAKRRDHFIGGDPHDGPMPMDYFVWLAVGPSGAYVIDTGFTAEMAKERKRTFLRCPIDSLSLYTAWSVSYLPASGDQFSALTG
jgi:hypothetical protein